MGLWTLPLVRVDYEDGRRWRTGYLLGSDHKVFLPEEQWTSVRLTRAAELLRELASQLWRAGRGPLRAAVRSLLHPGLRLTLPLAVLACDLFVAVSSDLLPTVLHVAVGVAVVLWLLVGLARSHRRTGTAGKRRDVHTPP